MSEVMVTISAVTDNTTGGVIANLSRVGSLDGKELALTLGPNFQQGTIVAKQIYTIDLDTGSGTVTYTQCTSRGTDSDYAYFHLQ